MTEAEEEKKLEARLENWGRWLREGRHVGISNIWPVLQRLPKLKEDESQDSSFTVGGDVDTPQPVYEKDALKVQRAWNLLPRTSMADQEARALIGAVYAYQGFHMDRILYLVRQVYYSGGTTPIRVRRRDVDGHLDRARTMLQNLLKKLDEVEPNDIWE